MNKLNRNGRKMRHGRKEDYKKTEKKKSGRMRRKMWERITFTEGKPRR
jgi:hypothetical protein